MVEVADENILELCSVLQSNLGKVFSSAQSLMYMECVEDALKRYIYICMHDVTFRR